MDSFNEDNIVQLTENSQHHHSPVVAGAIGFFIGHMLSKTRFGRWFEHSPVIGFIFFIAFWAAVGYAAFCGVTFAYFLIKIMLAG